MKKVAEIYKSKVVSIHEVPDDFTVEFSPKSFRFAVDLTGIEPQPAAGWSYDFETGLFAEPGPVLKPVIPVNEFWDRFTDDEKEAVTNSTNAKLVKYRFDIFSIRQTVNLADAKTITAINLLESAGFIAAGRAAEILKIGEQ